MQLRRRTAAGGQGVADVVVVAAEELVPAFARQRDLDVLARQLRDEEGRDRRSVGERLVERRRQLRQQLGGIRAGARARGGRCRSAPRPAARDALVELAFLESDRERADRARAFHRRERGEHGRIEAAGEEDAHRHVGDEVCPDRVAQALAELLGELVLAFGANVVRRDAGAGGVLLETYTGMPAFRVPDEQAARRKLASLRKIVSGAGTKLKARNASSASRSISREKPGWRRSALSSEPKERLSASGGSRAA